MTVVFALTGGIAAGKSTVSAIFSKFGIAVVDADQVSRVIASQGPIIEQVKAAFGADVVTPEGLIDRKRLGRIVFTDETKRRALNAIMFPPIREEGRRQIQAKLDEGHRIVCWDAALLLEAGNPMHFHPIVVVEAPLEARLERLKERNNLTRDEALARINSQPDPHWIADFIIRNDHDLAVLEKSAQMLANALWKRARAV